MSSCTDSRLLEILQKAPNLRSNEDVMIVCSFLHDVEALSCLRESSLQTLCRAVRYEKRYPNDIVYCRGEISTCWYVLLSGSVFIDGFMFLPRSSFGKRSGNSGRRLNECLILETSELIVEIALQQRSSSKIMQGPMMDSHPIMNDLRLIHIISGVATKIVQGLVDVSVIEEKVFSHIIIDYPDIQLMRPGQRQSCTTMNLEKLLALEQEDIAVALDKRQRLLSEGSDDPFHQRPHHHLQLPLELQGMFHKGENLLKNSNRSSHSSDTSSAYSGSDTMHSVHSSLEDQEVDLSGLIESVVDSDEEEDLAESISNLTVRDTVRECLEKDPCERTEDDIEVLLEFMQHLPAFANMTLAIRRALCAVMVFAVVEKAGTIVMNDGEELDSWSVIVNGYVEVEQHDGHSQELHLGDSFGITPTTEKMYHQGVMRTKVDDCQFVCIAQSDYYHILHQGEENTRKHEEDGEVVLITEHRVLDAGSRHGHVVIRGTMQRLTAHLVEDNALDPGYVEDFLLTYRTFISTAVTITEYLLRWFSDPLLRDKVTRVVLLWVNNHFTDFETDPEMMEFLENFEAGLEKEKMQSQLRLLNIACATKARNRTVTLARSTRDEVLHFHILGGYERGFGIFVSKVDKDSKAEDVGLKRGDQILEVNGQSFEHMSHAKALEVLRGTTHLSITVRSNLLGFKEMLNTPENSPRPRGRKASEIAKLQPDPQSRLSTHFEWRDIVGIPIGVSGFPLGVPSFPTPSSPPARINSQKNSNCSEVKKEDKKGFMTLGHKARIKKALVKMIIPKTLNHEPQLNSSDDSLYSMHSGSSAGSGGIVIRGPSPHCSSSSALYHSHSNPDLTTLTALFEQPLPLDYPEHVLKVYRSDQTFKFLLIHKETTAREVVMLSLREFSITDPSSNYSLREVSVGHGGMVKQRRLPDQLQNLAERLGLSSRYYLKKNSSTEPLVPDDLAAELLHESQVHFLQLNSVEVATQLTLEDFSIFCQIEPTEYIDDLFEVPSKYGTPQLSKFVELVNHEMFWVVTEVCSEHQLIRRMRIVKQFIKVARQCKVCKNFNSMFAILSGLGHGAVSRLRATWEKLPTKYQKMFNDLQDLMDPSRNMCKYRNLLNSEHTQPPMIPFYPVVRKDLTFIHLGNDTMVDNLVNFEKLRMIAKEVRQLMNMCSAPYDLFNMLEIGGAQPTAAMASLNSFATATNAATVKRRKKSTTQPNPKKMFEEAQMVRRVKTYLSNLKVISNEEKLRIMSLDCEPTSIVTIPTPVVTNVQPRKRHPSPTLSTASSNSSASESKKSIGAGPKFGADSPQAVRKLLALSDQSKVRPHQPPRHHHSLSPSPSPNSIRKKHDGRQGHGRSHSDTANPSVLPVDLNVESSSVTALNNLPLRKSQTSGSVTSSDSSSTGSYHHHTLYEVDSGHVSGSIDSHSSSSLCSSNSPPQRRNQHAATPNTIQPPPPPRGAPPPPYPRSHRPPDYNIAAQMAARSRQMLLGRAHSHEGSCTIGYYGSDFTDPEDDDDETQVSAV